MKITFDVDVKINSEEIAAKVMNDTGLWTYAASEWHKLYAPYVPMDTGMLAAKQVRIGKGEIEHFAPYAHRHYEGHFNYGYPGNKHPKASRKWDKAAEPTQKPSLVKAIQGYIDSGKIDLD